jgi:Na+-transporting NADH:ubiquinone oxidoreductase subunit NqrB
MADTLRAIGLITTFLAVVTTLAFICADVVKLKLWDVSWSQAPSVIVGAFVRSAQAQSACGRTAVS